MLQMIAATMAIKAAQMRMVAIFSEIHVSIFIPPGYLLTLTVFVSFVDS